MNSSIISQSQLCGSSNGTGDSAPEIFINDYILKQKQLKNKEKSILKIKFLKIFNTI